MIKRVPLPRTFMLISILGFLIVTVFTFNPFFTPANSSDKPGFSIDLKYGMAFDIVFITMFIASVLSITPPSIEQTPEISRLPASSPAGRGKRAKRKRK